MVRKEKYRFILLLIIFSFTIIKCKENTHSIDSADTYKEILEAEFDISSREEFDELNAKLAKKLNPDDYDKFVAGSMIMTQKSLESVVGNFTVMGDSLANSTEAEYKKYSEDATTKAFEIFLTNINGRSVNEMHQYYEKNKDYNPYGDSNSNIIQE